MSKFQRPTLEMTLPSRGKLYGGAIPNGVIQYHPITMAEEKLLAGGAGNKGLIDSIIKSCIPTLPIPTGQLLSSDRFFILMILRAESYGAEYKFDMKCGECNTKFKNEVSLTDVDTFPVKILEEGDKEPFEVKLPISGHTVGFRLLRGEDEQYIQKFADKEYAKGNTKGDPSYIYSVALRLMTLDGESLDGRLVTDTIPFVTNLIGRDSAVLRSAMEKADCGLDVTLRGQCPRCEADYEQPLPLTAEFFRPRF